MTKENLMEEIVKKTGSTKSQAGETLNVILEIITNSLVKGNPVVLTGFGSFRISKRKARMGRNPKTGEALKIPAMKVPKFKAGKTLKEAVR